MSPEELLISKLDKKLSKLNKGMHTAGPQYIMISETTAVMIRERLKQYKEQKEGLKCPTESKLSGSAR